MNGLKPQDRVIIQWSNSIEAVQLYFAVFKAGLIAVPVNTRLKAPEVAYIQQHSEARLCFSEPSLAEVARQAGVKNPLTTLPEGRNDTSTLPVVDPESRAAILYTSGTTARPKGVVHTHRTLLANAHLTVTGLLQAARRALSMTPLAYASGLICSLVPAGLADASIVLLRAFSPAEVLDAIERFGCTYFVSLPALVQLITNEQEARPRRVKSMRTILVGGDSVPPPLFERVKSLFSVPLFEGLGMTEAVPIIANSPAAQRPGSLGLPVEGVDVRIVDSEDRDLPDGESGEIVVRSPGNCVVIGTTRPPPTGCCVTAGCTPAISAAAIPMATSGSRGAEKRSSFAAAPIFRRKRSRRRYTSIPRSRRPESSECRTRCMANG